MCCSSKSPSSGRQCRSHWHNTITFLLPTAAADSLPPYRDALSDLALHFLNKMKIMVVKDIEREDIEFICKVRSAKWL